MTQGVHRATPNSRAGRKMRQAKGARLVDPDRRSEYARQQAEHNLRVENERKAELQARKERRG